MSEKLTISLPKLGESIQSAQIVSWLKKVGDPVRRDEPLCEVTTDKVNSEIPSPCDGILQEILAQVDSVIQVGAPLAVLSQQGQGSVREEEKEEPISSCSSTCASSCEKKERFFSPAVMRLAEMESISLEVLHQLSGTGEGGRLTKRDIEIYLLQKQKQKASSSLISNPDSGKNEERVPMSGIRKAIAENMARSFYEAPHASLVVEADVTELMEMIAKEKGAFVAAHNAKLTITSFLIQAVTKAIAQYPLLNASLDGETIIMKRYVNVGLAVHIEGGLLVPVIKNCQDRNLVSIAKAIADLSLRAREKKLSPDEVKDGTITLTNFGMTGALIGVPIIRYPEVAIIGAGTIQKRVMVREDNAFAIRQMLYLTLTFDHRLIDGIYGCEFLGAVKNNLETVVSQ